MARNRCGDLQDSLFDLTQCAENGSVGSLSPARSQQDGAGKAAGPERLQRPRRSWSRGLRGLTLVVTILTASTAVDAAVIFVLDLSASMSYRFGKRTRLQAAQRGLIESLWAHRPDEMIGLIGFPGGGNCRTRLLVQMQRLGKSKLHLMRTIYQQIPMANGTPLAASIEQAGRLAHSRLGRTRVVILTDGLETCGGNPIASALKWRSRTKRIEFHVIGIALDQIAARQMKILSIAGGGTFQEARSFVGLRKSLTAFASRRKPEVRGCKASVAGDFRDNADGTTTDLRSGLTWQRCEAGRGFSDCQCRTRARRLKWRQARNYCRDLKLAGLKWGLPNLQQARSLYEPERRGVDLEGLPATAPFVIWTGKVFVNPHGAEAHAYNLRKNHAFMQRDTARHLVRCVAQP